MDKRDAENGLQFTVVVDEQPHIFARFVVEGVGRRFVSEKHLNVSRMVKQPLTLFEGKEILIPFTPLPVCSHRKKEQNGQGHK
ncbi:hypothetical protein [Pseudodesulfovibrio cashew]|uniref:hypothetical protein n=1 Tax=Pseudodesulfovibrio cashew TaxID=2678688 RepID=UPI001F5520CD|nr:hypothetical protein [Pseudodesulfovibrio cashew]